jgi:outer membrane protein
VGNRAESSNDGVLMFGRRKADFLDRRRRAGAVAAVGLLGAACATLVCSAATAQTLKEALAAAYRLNPQLDAERARLRATDEEVARANAGYRPVITGSADINYERRNTDPASTSDGELHSKGYSVNLTQPIFRGFRTLNQVREAEATVRAGRESLRLVEQNVLLAAATAYVDVVRDQAIVRLNENNVNVLTRELRATQDRFNVGEVTRTDVAQATARRAGAVSQLEVGRANLKASRAAFERVVGAPPGRLTEPPTPNGVLPKSLEEAVQIHNRENPSVVGALYLEQASRHTVDRIRGELLPTVELEASYSQRFDPSRTTEESEQGTLTGRLSVPIYQGGEIDARVRQAKHTHVSRIQQIEQARSEGQENVVASWSRLIAAQAQQVSAQSQVEANQTALQGVREEERVGQRTLLDVLDAEQELLNSQVSLVTAKRDTVVQAYALLAAIGRLNAQELELTAVVYDPEVNYQQVRRQWWGLSITHADGRHEVVDRPPDSGKGTPGK